MKNERANPCAPKVVKWAVTICTLTLISTSGAWEPLPTRISPHETLWEGASTVLTETGDELTDIHRYREVGTGINYFDETASELRPSDPSFEIVNGKGVVRRTMHKAVFAGSTLDENVLAEIWSADG